MTSATQARAEASLRRHLRLGTGAVLLLLGGLGGWAALADISGAVIAPGTLVVESDVKKVQHPTGGIVGELRVRDGDLVRAGDILLRLDDTLTRSNLAIASKAIDELTARQARLEAERDAQPDIVFPGALREHAHSPDVAHIMDGERRLFQLRRAARDGQRAELKERAHQLSVHTLGGVITAGDPILLIVPDGDVLSVEVKVTPSDINELQLGQSATLRFSAFNLRTTPELSGSVSRISADSQSDEKTGMSYYVVRIAVTDAERARLGSLKLIPGMPVEAFIKTQDRTVISYLVKPLTDQMHRALRED
jgi:multidrug efflux pump subunit AcrA (membrane-fusion protein)